MRIYIYIDSICVHIKTLNPKPFGPQVKADAGAEEVEEEFKKPPLAAEPALLFRVPGFWVSDFCVEALHCWFPLPTAKHSATP